MQQAIVAAVDGVVAAGSINNGLLLADPAPTLAALAGEPALAGTAAITDAVEMAEQHRSSDRPASADMRALGGPGGAQ